MSVLEERLRAKAIARFALVHSEREILIIACRGMRCAEIAAARGARPTTVKKQVQRICRVTGASSLAHAAILLTRLTLLDALFPNACSSGPTMPA